MHRARTMRTLAPYLGAVLLVTAVSNTSFAAERAPAPASIQLKGPFGISVAVVGSPNPLRGEHVLTIQHEGRSDASGVRPLDKMTMRASRGGSGESVQMQVEQRRGSSTQQVTIGAHRESQPDGTRTRIVGAELSKRSTPPLG